jgi:hypothetical protein
VISLCRASLAEIQEGAIEVALDNKSAAEQSAGDWLLRPWQRDYDMLLDIRSRLQALPIQVNFRMDVENRTDRRNKTRKIRQVFEQVCALPHSVRVSFRRTTLTPSSITPIKEIGGVMRFLAVTATMTIRDDNSTNVVLLK